MTSPQTSIRHTNKLLALLTTAVLAATSLQSLHAQPLEVSTEQRNLTVTEVAAGLDHPWSIAFISNNDWLVTERAGRLRRITDGKLLADPISGLPEIASVGQGGLLDVALHPDFNNNRLVYLSYVGEDDGTYGTEVVYGQLDGNHLKDAKVIFKALPKSTGGRHFGSRLAFDENNMLYISLGDRGSKESAQKLSQHPGSIIRLHADGKVPDNNPFAHDINALPEIYSYGHRNVQGLAFDKQTNTLWAHEHGPQGGDELNQVIAGQNYGWPTITFGANYGTGTSIGIGTKNPGMLQPITYWDPSIAPSGLAIVNGEKYPNWQNNLLVGALKFQLVARIELKENTVTHEERMLEGKLGRIRDIKQSPDGVIYLLTDADNGKVYRLD